MKKIIISCIITLMMQINYAQNTLHNCGTPEMDTVEFEQLPWFGYNDYLENFLDSIGYPGPQNRIATGTVKYWIPVKLWVYVRADGTGGPDELDIQRIMDRLNRQFITNN